MRMRSRFRTRFLSKNVTIARKKKMELNVVRRSKRKSPHVTAIFELNDGDVSPEPDDVDSQEPQAKIQKKDEDLTNTSKLNTESSNANLKVDVEIQSSPKNASEIIQKVVKVELEQEVTRITTVGTVTENLEESCNSEQDKKILEDGEVPDDNTATGSLQKENIIETKPSVIPVETSIPCFSIKFHDKDEAETYKQKCIQFLQSFVELTIDTTDDLTINVKKDLSLNPSDWIIVDETQCINSEEPPEQEEEEELAKELPETPVITNSKKKKKKRTRKEKELFVLDATPSLETHKKNSPQTKYSTKFLIDDIQNDKNEDKSREGLEAAGQVCFNCGSNHSLKDCPEPKVMGRINANRQKFNMGKQKSSRYHLEEDQKYHHLKPGQISSTLRDALGLRKHQLPSYIYQMRVLGYPPGWLEEAKLVHSNLAMYDVDGNNVKEVRGSRPRGLDEEKIVDFPGFNVPLEKGFKDEFKQHGTPPYSEQYNKEKMIEFFRKQCMKDVDDLETCDMDLDTTSELEKNECLIETEILPTEVAEISQIKVIKDIQEVHSNIPSPSLNDLEVVKETLLAALNNDEEIPEIIESTDNNVDDDPSEITAEVTKNDYNEECVIQTEEMSNDSETDKKSTDSDVSKDDEISPTSVDLSQSINNTASSKNTIKTSCSGTPIIKSSSPYAKLPNPDNFSKDVSPVINFENLPNSTGKYDQMTGVLQKVRNTLKNLQQKCK